MTHPTFKQREPYVMERTEGELDNLPTLSKERYEGLCIDIMDEIASRVGFEYDLIVKNTSEGYGYFDENTGSWNGLVGDIVRRVRVSGILVNVGFKGKAFIVI